MHMVIMEVDDGININETIQSQVSVESFKCKEKGTKMSTTMKDMYMLHIRGYEDGETVKVSL